VCSSDLAAALGGEIVNADSVQIYRGLDIGSAKTPAAGRRGIRHHLIDILEPQQVFSAGDWAVAAREALEGIHLRTALPVITGGTGFYIRTLLEGISESPKRDEGLRAEIAAREAARPGLVFRALRRMDAPTAGRIHPNDSHKLLRALEICLLARRPASQHFAAAPMRPLEGYRVAQIILAPPRQALHERIAQRTMAMFSAGLVEEVKKLLADGVPAGCKAFESIGYKECLKLLRGEITETEAREQVTIATRQYAKRQETWFRKDSNTFRINTFGDSDAAFATALQWVNRRLLA